jgi:3-methyladenine DNA glycosylase/8-oxoguanine DNA glycosylase
MPSRLIATDARISIASTLGPLVRGRGDPTMRVARGEAARASRTPEGPVTVRFREVERGVEAVACGPGSGWVLDRADAWCGALDDVSRFDPPPGLVREVWRHQRGLRIPSTGLVSERLVPVILEQKVTGMEARRAYRAMTLALGEPAPGDLGLRLPPDPQRLAALPYERFHPFGVERKRAEVIREVARKREWLDAAAELPLPEARARIGSLRGIGPWSVAEVGRLSLGDADAVSVGDFHVPNIVAWALGREPRGTDERMLELLEPYAPHRGRVQRLIEMAGVTPPRFGPRMEVRSIASI